MIRDIFIFSIVLLTCKTIAQDIRISFDVTYKNDMQKTYESARQVIGNIFDQESKQKIITDSLESAKTKKEYVDNMAGLMPMMMIPQLSKYKNIKMVIKDSLHQEIKILASDTLDQGSVSKLSELTKYYKSESLLLRLEEDSTDTKDINGYICHKVYLNYVEGLEMPLEFSFTVASMYVTDKIKIPFHPVIKFKSILEKYYPLEITTVMQLMKGFEINYKLKELICEE